MKLKYYLRGIGIGILVTTIIFMISISIHKQDTEQESSKKEENVVSGTVADLQKDTEGVEQDKMTEVESQDTETEFAEEKEESLSEETEEDSESDVAVIEVVAGEFSDEICKKIKDAGIVEDAWDLNVYLMEINYDNLIRPGTYEIPKGATYEEIAELLLSR
ncbi:MAG: hypothetical protein J6A75_07310 [Lachnospiraceae bacterium]|nr:hypothetical protein [Lachnospiraceae bacterium]